MHSAEFVLGDFNMFGQFLHDLVGAARKSRESADGQ
jgi:hypothetical protein